MTVEQIGEVDFKITTEHQVKIACVYIRRSSLGQVTHHRESTEPQYQLLGRVKKLGRAQDRIEVIVEALGKSGVSETDRHRRADA